MKRFLILFMMLCLIMTAFMVASCGGNTDTDTDTNTDTDTSVDTSTDTDQNVDKELTCEITVKDQEGDTIADAKISIVDKDENEVKSVTTDANGKVTVTFSGECYADITELPEGYLDVAGLTKLDKESIEIEIQNNIPNGTIGRPYPVQDQNEIKLGANETVYYIIYGGSRNFLIENAQGLVVTYGSDEPREADEENKISFKMPPTEASSRAVIVKLENKLSEEKTYNLTIFSDKGELDNPFDVVLGQLEKVTVEKEKIVYFRYVAEKDGMVVVYSETKDNSIYFYNTTKMVVSPNTNGSNSTYIYANKGDEITVYVSSNAANNYNKVEFSVNQYAGTDEDPIPLYKNSNSFMLQPSQSLTFSVKPSWKSELSIEGVSYKLVINGEEKTPDEDGIIYGIELNADEEISFTVVSENENGREDITVSYYEIFVPES
ncbi:MAG: carboxypeptidase regulatory-like domain-containing protein [Clostridia bacterium]|nr:carboxypeptidase regulatory-like domain-containing protein [Clostridia bacterium]